MAILDEALEIEKDSRYNKTLILTDSIYSIAKLNNVYKSNKLVDRIY